MKGSVPEVGGHTVAGTTDMSGVTRAGHVALVVVDEDAIELGDISQPVTDAIAPAPLSLFDESELTRATITIGGVQFVFDQPTNGQCLAFKRVKSRAHGGSRWSPYPTRQEPGLLYVPEGDPDDDSQSDIRTASAKGTLHQLELITEVKKLSIRGATGPLCQGRRVSLPPPWES